MWQQYYPVPEGFVTTNQAAKIIGKTTSTVKYQLKKPDKYIKLQKGKIALWDNNRVRALAAKILAAQKSGKSRLPPAPKDKYAKEYDKYSRPLDAPTYRGRMCPFCKEVEVPTGTYCCSKCRREKTRISVMDEGNWVYD